MKSLSVHYNPRPVAAKSKATQPTPRCWFPCTLVMICYAQLRQCIFDTRDSENNHVNQVSVCMDESGSVTSAVKQCQRWPTVVSANRHECGFTNYRRRLDSTWSYLQVNFTNSDRYDGSAALWPGVSYVINSRGKNRHPPFDSRATRYHCN